MKLTRSSLAATSGPPDFRWKHGAGETHSASLLRAAAHPAAARARADRIGSKLSKILTRLPLLAAFALCLLSAPSAFAAGFSYVSSVNSIYVFGAGAATLSEIQSALPAAPLDLVDPTNHIWLLRANLVLQQGATLVLHGTAVGGDVNQLRLQSIATVSPCDCVVSITANWGALDINGVKLTSWDTVAGAPNTNDSSLSGRSYIAAYSSLSGSIPLNSRMDITNSELCYLGATNAAGYGVVWKLTGTNFSATNNPYGVAVSGSVVNSLFHDNYMGVYTSGASNMLWLNNQIYSNSVYGLDLEDYSSSLRIASNSFLNNAKDGLLVGAGCSQLTLLANLAANNGAGGITLDHNAASCLIETNLCLSNTTSGIALDQTSSNTVRGNLLFSNQESGLRLTLGSAYNLIQNNEFASNKYGCTFYPGTGIPNPGDDGHPKWNTLIGNLVHDNVFDPVLFTNSDNNTLATNNFTDLAGKLRFNNSLSNWLDGNLIGSGLTVRTEGDTNDAALTYVRNVSSLTLELVTNATVIVEDAQNRIYQPNQSTILTTVSSNGSILTLTAATNVSSTTTIVARDLFVNPSPGSATVDELVWTNANGKQWKTAAGSLGQTLTFTVGDLDADSNYTVLRGTFPLTNLTSDASGQLQFSDVATASNSVVYSVLLTNLSLSNFNNFSYSASLNKLYVMGGVSATLSQILSNLPGAPLELLDPTNEIWLLSANLVVQDGSKLILHGSAVGGDVNELRILSLNSATTNPGLFLEADYGAFDLNSTKITSWDTNISGPDTNALGTNRAYIAVFSSVSSNSPTPLNSRMDITNSELCFLGGTNSNGYGVVWKVFGTDGNPTNNPDGVVVSGNVVGSRFHDNNIGAYAFGASNMLWLNNQISNNAAYGLDLQNYSSDLLIESNLFYNNGDDGLLAGLGCNQLTIFANTAATNGSSGLTLNLNAANNLIETNLCLANGASGISLDQSASNIVQGNLLLINNEAGLRLTLGSANNLIQDNQSAGNKYGFYSYIGAGAPNPGDDGHPKWNTLVANLVHDNVSDPILLTNSDNNTLASNNFTDLTGKLRFNNSLSNWLDGNLIGSGLTVRTEGDTNDAASTYIRNQASLTLELVTNATVLVEDAQNRIYQANDNSIETVVSAGGSVMTITAATNASTTKTIAALDFFAGASPGSALIDHLLWTNANGKQWTATAGSLGQTLSFNVGDLDANSNYTVLRGTFPLTNLTSDASGQLQFSDVAASTNAIVYSVIFTNTTIINNTNYFSYSPSLNKLYVMGGVSATLSQILSNLPGTPLELLDPTNGIWLLSANLVIQDGSKLILHGSAVGGDVNELRILSLNFPSNSPPLTLEADYGSLDLNSTKITSWDTNTSGPDTNALGGSRAYLAVFSSPSSNSPTALNSRMDITNSELCFLGGTNSNGSGVVWKVSGADPNPSNNPYGVVVSGNVVGSLFHGNNIGAYTFGASNMLWLNNQIYSNAQYGLDLQDYSSSLLIQSNSFDNNGNDGLLAGLECNQLTILANSAATNAGSGLLLNQNANNNLLGTNLCLGNAGFGIALDQSASNTVQGNSLWNNQFAGLRLTLGSAANLIQSNESAFNGSYGFNAYPGTGTPNPGDDGHPKWNLLVGNLAHDNRSSPILFTNSDNNTIASNSFTDLSGKLMFENSLTNLLDGNAISLGMTVMTKGTTTAAASTFVLHATALDVNLGTNATTTVEDPQGRIYQPGADAIPTVVSSSGSIMTLTPAEIGAGTTVTARDFFVTASPGSASIAQLVWASATNKQWTATAGSLGQTLSFVVGDLAPNTAYVVWKAGQAVADLISDGSGQLQFSDTANTGSPVLYAVSVSNTSNTPPSLPFQPNVTISALTSLTVTNTASDTNVSGYDLTYVFLSAPTNASISTNGIITWTPTGSQAGSTNLFTTAVTDNGSPPLSATNSFTVIVLPLPSPVLPIQTNITINAGTVLAVTNTATDSASPPAQLTYQLTAAPTNAVIDTNGVISWATVRNQGPGTNLITTVVSDGDSPPLTATNSFTVFVLPLGSPVLPIQTNMTINPGAVLVVTNTATDPAFPTNQLTYQLTSAPTNAAIDSNGVITWATVQTQGASSNLFTTIVSDGGLPPILATNSFTVFVLPISPPMLPNLTNFTIVAGRTLVVVNTASDSSTPPNQLTYHLIVAPASATINSNGVITWATQSSQSSSPYQFITVVTDNGSPPLSATNLFTVFVVATNLAPALPIQTNVTIVALTPLVVTNTAADSAVPPSQLTYLLTTAPTNAAIDTNGIITWTPTQAQGPSTNLFTTLATDNGTPALFATNSFTVFVLPVSSPVLPNQTNMTITLGATLVVTNTATDSNAPPRSQLTYQLTAAPTNAVIDTNGVITWATSAAQATSTNVFTTVVSDGGVPPLSATNSFLVFVTQPQVSLQILNTLTNGIVVSWSATSGSWQLQQTTDFGTTNWVNVDPALILSVGNQNQTTITNLTQNAYFRLMLVQP